MSSLYAERRHRGRHLLPFCAALLSAVAGFVVLTAVGVGGGPANPAAPRPLSALTPLAAYSHAAGLREGAGNAPGARPVTELVPVPPPDFAAPIAASRVYAARQLRAMELDVRRLIAALASGSRARSRGAWRVAFGRYLRLGAVYGEFGRLDTAIDGEPGALAGGPGNPAFSGLHRLEFGLWTARLPRALVPVARRLAADIRRLEKIIPTVAISPLDYATRAHEILEDDQRDFLSGADVRWSGEGVLATAAGLAATEALLATLRPLLDGRGSVIEQVDFGLLRLRTVLAGIRTAHAGSWPVLAALTQSESERLDGAVGFALGELAGVPGVLETRLPPAIPSIGAASRSR